MSQILQCFFADTQQNNVHASVELKAKTQGLCNFIQKLSQNPYSQNQEKILHHQPSSRKCSNLYRIFFQSFSHPELLNISQLFKIEVDFQMDVIVLSSFFLEEQKYWGLKQCNARKAKNILRKIHKFNQKHTDISYCIDSVNGRFSSNLVFKNFSQILKTTGHRYSQSFRSENFAKHTWKIIRGLISKLKLHFQTHFLQLLQITNRQHYREYVLNSRNVQLKKVIQQFKTYSKIVKQIDIGHINLGLSSKIETRSSIFSKQVTQEKLLRDFTMNILNEDLVEQRLKNIFHTNNLIQLLEDSPQSSSSLSPPKPTYELQVSQYALYSSYLHNPQPKSPNPGENIYLFNYIEIQNPKDIRFLDSNLQGGFNKIKVAKIPFQYIQSGNTNIEDFYTNYNQKVDQLKQQESQRQSIFGTGWKHKKKRAYSINDRPQNAKTEHILTKNLAVKIPSKHQYVFSSSNKEIQNPYQNQKNIVRTLKSGVSAYILKYYISKQKQFKYHGHLLMDYLPSTPPLSTFIEIHQLSLNSKIFLLVNLSSALRFLADYQIVHMDLNLNNILVCRGDMLTKIIDFGEAYSSKLQNIGQQRSYTFPFCSPQYFDRHCDFSFRQDVFSFGIILYRLCFDQYPFSSSLLTGTMRNAYKSKSYMKTIFLAPQNAEYFGNQSTILLLYKIFFRSDLLSPHLKLQDLLGKVNWVHQVQQPLIL